MFIDSSVKTLLFFSISVIFFLIGCIDSSVDHTIQPVPDSKDTTSHEVFWMIPDTIADDGIVRDIWIFDQSNIWAVGEYYVNDSTGNPDYGVRYNASHWDGKKWSLTKIKVTYLGIDVVAPLDGIYAFSPTDIWLCGDFPIHGDGVTWKVYDIRSMPGLEHESVSKAWGQNTNEMYFVGRSGSIIRYADGAWAKIHESIDVNYNDVFGVDGGHVWCSGYNSSTGRSVVLRYSQSIWSAIYDNENDPNTDKYFISSVWGANESNMYLVGASGAHKYDSALTSIKKINIPDMQYVCFSVRGSSDNDIFVSGEGSEVFHFNGHSWHRYENIKSINSGFAWFTKVVPKKDIVVIGGGLTTKYGTQPIVIRGYR